MKSNSAVSTARGNSFHYLTAIIEMRPGPCHPCGMATTIELCGTGCDRCLEVSEDWSIPVGKHMCYEQI